MKMFIYSITGIHKLVTDDVAKHFVQKPDWFLSPKERDDAVKALKAKAKEAKKTKDAEKNSAKEALKVEK